MENQMTVEEQLAVSRYMLEEYRAMLGRSAEVEASLKVEIRILRGQLERYEEELIELRGEVKPGEEEE